ncbi:MAG TPA: A24 family peptidase [Nitrospiraceae bacterium]|nr:A24 family peptidase [Nitrospiraceae bacterium]
MEQAMVVGLIALLITAIVTDLRSCRIPNWLTTPAMVFGLAVHAWQHGLQGLLFSLFGLFVGLGSFLLLHLSGNIGAGDVKLMAAVGAMVGPHDAFMSAVLAIMVGGFYALVAMVYQWGLVSTIRRLSRVFQGLVATRMQVAYAHELVLPFRLRYGLAIAGGTLLLQLGLHPFGG